MKKAFNLALALFPIISGYGFSPSLDFGSLLLFFLGVGCVAAYPQKFKIKFPLGYMAFFVVALLLSLLWARSVPLRLLLFSANLCFACCYAKWDYLWKYYQATIIVCGVFFILQEALFYTTGFRPSGLLSILPVIYGNNAAMVEDAVSSFRSASFFLEPSYFAQYLVPYIIVCLFSTDKKDRKNGLIASVLLLLIRSGMGILALGVIWLLWFLFSKTKTTYKIIVGLAALGVLGILAYTGSSVFDYISGRSVEMLSYSGDERYMSSGFIRFFRGYYAFADMSVFDKLFGANPSVVHDFLNRNIFFGSDESNFLNGAQTLLFYNGIIGTLFFLRHTLLFPYKSHNRTLLVFSVCVILLMLGESFYLCSRWLVMVVFMQLLYQDERMKVNNIERNVIQG